MQQGTKRTLNLGPMLSRWLSLHGTGLRARPQSEKAAIMADVRRRPWPLVTAGTVRAVVHERLPLTEAMAAHRLLADGVAFGKVQIGRASCRERVWIRRAGVVWKERRSDEQR